MKSMMINVKAENGKQMKAEKIKKINFASDWFKCRSCGYTVRMRVRGNTAKCSQCGGTMDRI